VPARNLIPVNTFIIYRCSHAKPLSLSGVIPHWSNTQ